MIVFLMLFSNCPLVSILNQNVHYRKLRLRQVLQTSPSAKNRALGEEGFAKCLALGEASTRRRRLRQVPSTRRRKALGEMDSSPSARHSAKNGTRRGLTASIPIHCRRLRQVPPSGTWRRGGFVECQTRGTWRREDPGKLPGSPLRQVPRGWHLAKASSPSANPCTWRSQFFF